jgi:hypothetical protein
MWPPRAIMGSPVVHTGYRSDPTIEFTWALILAAVKEIGANVTGVQGDVANLTDLGRLFEAFAKIMSRYYADDILGQHH